MIDCSDENYLTAYDTLCNELANYSDELMEKPRIVLCNKIDVEGAFDRAVEVADRIRKNEPETCVIPVSVVTGRGMKDAQHNIIKLVNSQQKTENIFDNKNEEFGSSFMKSRSNADDFDDTEIQYPGSEG